MVTADGTSIEVVEDVKAFSALEQGLVANKHVALDTEFVRTNTFYPLLGLIQLADASGCILVDPLSMQDKTSLRDFLKNSQVTFVVHSCSEDLNLLFTSLDVIPATVFDTQLAAAFLGLGYSLSYQALVRDLLGIDIPKDETRSDWIKRPLSDSQKIYAATDVRYLLELRTLLEHKLKEKQVYDWFLQECNDLLVVAPESESAANWQYAYQNVNNVWRLNDIGVKYLQSLCVWREEEARRRDKPRSWIAKDGDLFQVASAFSKEATLSLQKLAAIDSLETQLLKRYGDSIVKLLTETQGVTAVIDRESLNNPLSASARKKLKDCQRVVQEIAGDLTIAPELLGRKKIILQLVRGFEQTGVVEWPTGISGWRRSILEPALASILSS